MFSRENVELQCSSVTQEKILESMHLKKTSCNYKSKMNLQKTALFVSQNALYLVHAMFGGRGCRGFVPIAIGDFSSNIKMIRRYGGWYYTRLVSYYIILSWCGKMPPQIGDPGSLYSGLVKQGPWSPYSLSYGDPPSNLGTFNCNGHPDPYLPPTLSFLTYCG